MDFGLSPATYTTIRQILARYPHIEKVIIYGSRARGNYKPGSDINLTLVGDGLDDRILSGVACDLDESYIPYSVDLSLFDNIRNSELRKHIETVGRVFYERKSGA